MKKRACIFSGTLLFILILSINSTLAAIEYNIESGQTKSATAFRTVRCRDYQFYDDNVTGLPAFIDYVTEEVVFEQLASPPRCRVKIKYSIEALVNAPAGVYDFSAEYRIIGSDYEDDVILEFEVGIDVSDISISPTTFVMPLSILSYFDSPGDFPSGLAFDGTYLWNVDFGNYKIYKLDTSGNIMTSFDSPGTCPEGLTYDGQYLWNTDSCDDKIYKLNTSGNIIASINAPQSIAAGIAFDGDHLWVAESSNKRIHKIDTAGQVNSSYDAPGSWPEGLAFDGQHLWHSDSFEYLIYRLNTSAQIMSSFESPGTWPKGLTFDGKHLWHADPGKDRIYKLSPPLVGTEKRNTFRIENDGVVNLSIGAVAITGADASEFSLISDGCSQQHIEPSGACTFDIEFTALSAGQKDARLEVPSNDPDMPVLSLPLNLVIAGNTQPGIVSVIQLLLFGK